MAPGSTVQTEAIPAVCCADVPMLETSSHRGEADATSTAAAGTAARWPQSGPARDAAPQPRKASERPRAAGAEHDRRARLRPEARATGRSARSPRTRSPPACPHPTPPLCRRNPIGRRSLRSAGHLGVVERRTPDRARVRGVLVFGLAGGSGWRNLGTLADSAKPAFSGARRGNSCACGARRCLALCARTAASQISWSIPCGGIQRWEPSE
jgi:hypothetical protein